MYVVMIKSINIHKFVLGNLFVVSLISICNKSYSGDTLVLAGTNSKITITSNIYFYSKGSIKNTGSCEFNNEGYLYITGSLTNTSTFASESTSEIEFCGTSSHTISNSSSLTFHDATINNSAGVVLSSGTLTIEGELALTSGVLTTGSNTIDLGATGSISEATPTATAPTSFITGKVKATRAIGSSANVTFGGIGIEINESGASNSTEVTRTTGTACSNGSNYSIKRYYDITPTTNSGLNATIKFYYFDDELDGPPAIAENNMEFFKSTTPFTSWTVQAYTTKDISNNWYSKSGISSFSRWTLADKDLPLPVELTMFTARCNGEKILLKWTTASESNNDYFAIERSYDAINFETICKVSGAGNSNTPVNYNYEDNTANINTKQIPTYYYRLKQTDYDGTTSYSDIAAASCTSINEQITKLISIQPNPTSDEVEVITVTPADEKIRVIVYNNNGEAMLKNTFYITAGQNINTVNMRTLENGIYLFNILTEKGEEIGSRHIIKKNN